MKTESEIRAAEQEFFDRVWYERHLALRDGYDSETREASDRFAEGIRARYHHLPAENDYERGMRDGKLSALRWVLGSDWDFLDT